MKRFMGLCEIAPSLCFYHWSVLIALDSASHLDSSIVRFDHSFFTTMATKRPYNDVFVILSAVFAAIGFIISWTWWVSFVFCLCGMIMFQMLWCCRQTSCALYTFASVAMVCSLIGIGLGIYFLTGFMNSRYCSIFYIYGGDDSTDPYNPNFCPGELWAGYAFVCGGLWFLASTFMFFFLISGRHARFEEKLTCPTATATATANAVVEMQVIDVGSENDFVPIVVPTEVLAPDP